MHSPVPVLENDTHKLLRYFDIPNFGQKRKSYNNQRKKRTRKIVNNDYQLKLKENEKCNTHVDLARELKK